MNMWMFNLAVSFVIPVLIIVYSNIYRDRAPKNIGGSNGYKTAMSRLNRDTWEFANHYYNGLMRVAGWFLLLFSLVVMLLVRGKDERTADDSAMIPLAAQVVVILVCMIPTELALRRTFEENGRRKK